MGLICGIDLGTTYSTVALFDKFGHTDILPNRDGHRLIPSAVAMDMNKVELEAGKWARSHSALYPDDVAMCFKRDMGTGKTFSIAGQVYSPTFLSAQVLAHIKDYMSYLISGSRVHSIVITVPANFSNDAREATLEAAQMAGLKVDHTIDEPTAAALYYALNSPHKLSGTYAVYDFGGGTFDISIVSIEDKNITVKVSNGIAKCGGMDFDDELQALFRRKYEIQRGQAIEDKHLHRLFDSIRIEEAKRSLSKRGRVDRFTVGQLVEVTRDEFEFEIQRYVDQAETCCKATLEEAGLKAADLAGVILAGGTTRVPLVRQSIERVFKCKPMAMVNVDAVVALGAAVYAAYRYDRALLTRAQIAVLGDMSIQEVTNLEHVDILGEVESGKLEKVQIQKGKSDNKLNSSRKKESRDKPESSTPPFSPQHEEYTEDHRQAEQLIRTAVGRPDVRLRAGQWEAIDTLVNDKAKLLVVERTGWGKSSVYFISTRILRGRGRGPTLIISPLLALMRNQIESAKRLGIRAETINSSNMPEWDRVKWATLGGRVDALLISPERLANQKFMETLLVPIADRIGMMVIDEAHCISDWGHDFRPDYQRLVNIVQKLPPNTPLLCTTATANDRVISDIERQFKGIRVQRGPLGRDSLELQSLRLPDQATRLAWLAEHIPELPGTGIVYVLTTRDTSQVASWLNQNGIRAEAYHGGITHEDFPDTNSYRLHLESLLLKNKIKALVATSALGMGYDKPDLGFVIHYQVPGSIITYYQQVGRAGRAIECAFGVLLAGSEDRAITEYFRNSAFPPVEHVEAILSVLEDSDGLSGLQIQGFVNLRSGQITKVLKLLSVETPSPVVKVGSKWQRTPVRYQMDHERIRRLTRQREKEWDEIQQYVDTDTCSMAYLQRVLNDPGDRDCGRCEKCLGRPIVNTSFDHELVASATRHLRKTDMLFQPKKLVPHNSLPAYGFKGWMSPDLLVSEGRILSRWRNAGWGELVAEGKRAGRFDDELVDAAAALIQEQWQPKPKPLWVTCVPSSRGSELVKSFGSRLARRLRLPFRAVVQVQKSNEQQKLQQNAWHQCRNLDGVFGIMGQIPSSPVLLVDDITDSGWTLTLVGALLRQRGSGPVYPLTLASTKPGG